MAARVPENFPAILRSANMLADEGFRENILYIGTPKLVFMQFEKAGAFIINKLTIELPAHLTYHCIGHVLDVYQAAEFLGKQEGISDWEMKLLLTAAWYHDAGFLVSALMHEEESCRIVKQFLPDFDYNPEEIEAICTLIRATKIPQSPENHLAQILADADLDYLGRNDFFTIGQQLYLEFLYSGVVKNETEWNQLQVRFMEAHHYFTASALNLRQQKKETNLAAVKIKLNKNITE